MSNTCIPRLVSQRIPVVLVVLMIAALSGASTPAFGQSVIMSLPEEPLNAPVIREAEAARQGTIGSRPAPSGNFLTYGPVSVRTNVMYRYMNAEGLPHGARRIASEIQTVTPTVALDLGQHWSVSYTPSWTEYTARALDDTFDQAAAIRGGLIGRYWLLGFNQNFSIASPTLYETGQQTEQKSWNTHVSASRSIGSRYNLELNGRLTELYTDIGHDTRDWSTEDWFVVQVSPAVNVGIGPTFGYVEILGAADMTYQRIMGRISFSPTDKITLSANGGMELRQTNSSLGKDLENPILNVSADYRPFETTSVGVEYDQTVTTSLYDSQVVVGANWRVHFEQRLLKHLFLSADWTRGENEYLATTVLVPAPPPLDPNGPLLPPILDSRPGRIDELEQFNCRLMTQILKRVTISLTYQQTDNQSSQGSFDVSSKQYGVEINCSF